jgi:hypothetical protein
MMFFMFISCLIELDVATRLALLPKYERLCKFKILIVIFMCCLTSDSYLVVLLAVLLAFAVLLALCAGLLIALPCVRACLPCCLLASLACGSTLGAPWVSRIEERVKPQPCVTPIGAEGWQAVRSEPLPLRSYMRAHAARICSWHCCLSLDKFAAMAPP